MNAKPTAISPGTLAFDALKVMENTARPLNVVPIVDGEQFKGVLRLHDLFKAGFTPSK